MIEFVFTVDYEIYGDGTGTLKDLVYEPAEKLRDIFQRWNTRFVTFVEVAEFEKIEAYGTDPSIDLVKRQIHDFHRDGFEIGLHLHPQWSNARYDRGRWLLDSSEYNLCTLPRARIAQIVERSLAYLRHVVNQPHFTPLCFRAGNWLFQPTQTASSVLADNGIKIDSSVFKGGLQRGRNLDYRCALNHGYYWPFKSSVVDQDPRGLWIEVPIHTDMVPFWRVPTVKRLGFLGHTLGMTGESATRKLNRSLDFLRFRYPLKLDFCRMTLNELTSSVDRVICEDREEPALYRPIVAIGHTKDLADPQTVGAFLSFLRANGIAVSTFEDVYPKLLQEVAGRAVADAKHEPEMRSYSKASASADGGARGKADLRYVLVTPARDEAQFIELTIKSVLAQTVRPMKWVIVSDGSTDGTDDIVRKYLADHPWIELVRMPERCYRSFAGKAHAFNAGYARVRDLEYEVIGNVDGDISFDEDYYSCLLQKLADDLTLGVVGTPFKDSFVDTYNYNFVGIEHVSGACQLFRRRCFEEIGGYVPVKGGGVDHVAVISARMKGWKTRTFLDKECLHHRAIGTADGSKLKAKFRTGVQDYSLGSHPIWEFFRTVYQMTKDPFFIGGLLLGVGYFWGLIRRADRPITGEMMMFRRREQMQRLRDILTTVMSRDISKLQRAGSKPIRRGNGRILS